MTIKALRLNTDLNDSTLILADGTIWSHAATLGNYVYEGRPMTIDREKVENFIRVFKAGYPRKVCVDYEHGSTNGATEAGQPVPSAGQVMELAGVFSADDFTGELKKTAEQLCAKLPEKRELGDSRNMGLWMRWRPTPRALRMINEREYTELSVTFFENYIDNKTGAGQGPALVAVALTNLPFLDEMLPVAASRGDGGSPTASGQEPSTMADNKPNMLQRLGAILGKPFVSEDAAADAAEAHISTLTRQRDEAVSFKAVAAEVGETDPAKAVEKVRELKKKAKDADDAVEASRKTAIQATADGILQKHENRLTPDTKKYFGAQLRAELEKGVEAGKTETEKVIGALPVITALSGRQSSADSGKDAPTDMDSRINERALSLLSENAELKSLNEKDPSKAFKRAISMARSELHAAK